jgi:CHRD domain
MYSKALMISAVALAAAFGLSASASAEVMKMKANLSAASEVPPTKSDGKGTADITYDTTSKKLSWKLNYTGLTGPATMAHFHGPASVTENHAPAVPIPDPKSGTEGSATLNDAQAKDLMDGKYYVNVHTDANKGGEIRGQVTK